MASDMTPVIPSINETITLSAEEAAQVRKVSRDTEAKVEEDIWGQRGLLLVTGEDEALTLSIKPLECDIVSVSCPLEAIQNRRDDEMPCNLHELQCFFRASTSKPTTAEEVWVRKPNCPANLGQCQHQGFVKTSNADKKVPFCHVSVGHRHGNVECSARNLRVRSADMVLGRACMVDYEEVADQRSGGRKLVATKVDFGYLEGTIVRDVELGVYIEPTWEIKYGPQSPPVLVIFAAFDRCSSSQSAGSMVGAKVYFHLQGPVEAPEACDWHIDGCNFQPTWQLPQPPQLNIGAPDDHLAAKVRWFPWQPDECALVIASDPKGTKFRDDAFECKLDESTGTGFLRVHIVNMAGRIAKDSPQERWMKRVLSRHHPSDAENVRPLFANWQGAAAGLGFTENEHRPALTMQLNMKHVGEGWAVDGPTLFFESMVRLSVIVDADKVTEEWVLKADGAETPTGLILHSKADSQGASLEEEVQRIFYDAQVVRDNRWRRLVEDGQAESDPEPESENADSQASEGDATPWKLPKMRQELSFNSNTRALTVVAEELQPSHFYAKRLLNVMNTEVFRVLDGYKELLGLAGGSSFENLEDRRECLIDVLSTTNIHSREEYTAIESVEDLEDLVWKDLGCSPSELYEAMGWKMRSKKMAMMADLPDGYHCHFEFSKPGRLYTQLVSQRIFLDFVRNGMKRPKQMSHSMGELRALMQYANNRQLSKERMDFTRDAELLQAAWPELMRHGGLPTKAVAVDNGAVFVQLIKERVSCTLQDVAGAPVPPGTAVIVKLQKSDSGYSASLLACHGRCPHASEPAEEEDEEILLTEEVIAASTLDASDVHAQVATADADAVHSLLRADAPAFYPKEWQRDVEDRSTAGSSD